MKKGILFLSLLLVFLLSCGKKTEVKEYEVTTVEKGDISLSTEKTGQVVSDNEISVLAHDISVRIENEVAFPGQIKVMVIRERRSSDYAKKSRVNI